LRNVWFKGAWGGEFLFALLREEWAARLAARAVDDRLADALSPPQGRTDQHGGNTVTGEFQR